MPSYTKKIEPKSDLKNEAAAASSENTIAVHHNLEANAQNEDNIRKAPSSSSEMNISVRNPFNPNPNSQTLRLKTGSNGKQLCDDKSRYTSLGKELKKSAENSTITGRVETVLWEAGEKGNGLYGKVVLLTKGWMAEGELGKQYCLPLQAKSLDLGEFGALFFYMNGASLDALIKGRVKLTPNEISTSALFDFGVMGPSAGLEYESPECNVMGISFRLRTGGGIGIGVKVTGGVEAIIAPSHLKASVSGKIGLFKGIGGYVFAKFDLGVDERFSLEMQKAYQQTIEQDPICVAIIKKMKTHQSLIEWERDYFDAQMEEVLVKANLNRWFGDPSGAPKSDEVRFAESTSSKPVPSAPVGLKQTAPNDFLNRVSPDQTSPFNYDAQLGGGIHPFPQAIGMPDTEWFVFSNSVNASAAAYAANVGMHLTQLTGHTMLFPFGHQCESNAYTHAGIVSEFFDEQIGPVYENDALSTDEKKKDNTGGQLQEVKEYFQGGENIHCPNIKSTTNLKDMFGNIGPVFKETRGILHMGVSSVDNITPFDFEFGLQGDKDDVSRAVSDLLNRVIVGDRFEKKIHLYGKTYFFEVHGRFMNMVLTVGEINDDDYHCNREKGAVRLAWPEFGSKKNTPIWDKIFKEYISPRIRNQFLLDQNDFLQQCDLALQQGDCSKARKLIEGFYNLYKGIFPSFEQEISNIREQISAYEKKLSALNSAPEGDVFAGKTKEDDNAHDHLQTDTASERVILEKALFRIESVQLFSDAVFFAIKKLPYLYDEKSRAERLGKNVEKVELPLVSALQLGSYHFYRKINHLEQLAAGEPTTPFLLDYAYYILFSTEIVHGAVNIVDLERLPTIKQIVGVTSNYVLPISHVMLSILSPNNLLARTLALFSPEILKGPAVCQFLLTPNPSEDYAYGRFMIGSTLYYLHENRKNSFGFAVKSLGYINVYMRTLLKGLLLALPEKIIRRLFSVNPLEQKASLNNLHLLLKLLEVFVAFYQSAQNAEKNWGEHCLRATQEQRKLYILSLYIRYATSNLIEPGVTPLDGNCLFNAIAYYAPYDHKELRAKAVEYLRSHRKEFETPALLEGNVDDHIEKMAQDGAWGTAAEVYSLAKVLNRPIIVIIPESANVGFDHINPVMYQLPGDPIFILLHENHHTACLLRGEYYFERDYARSLAKQRSGEVVIELGAITTGHEKIINSLDAIHAQTVESHRQLDNIQKVHTASYDLVNAINSKLAFFKKNTSSVSVTIPQRETHYASHI